MCELVSFLYLSFLVGVIVGQSSTYTTTRARKLQGSVGAVLQNNLNNLISLHRSFPFHYDSSVTACSLFCFMLLNQMWVEV